MGLESLRQLLEKRPRRERLGLVNLVLGQTASTSGLLGLDCDVVWQSNRHPEQCGQQGAVASLPSEERLRRQDIEARAACTDGDRSRHAGFERR